MKIGTRGAGFKDKEGHHLIEVSSGNPNGKLVPPPGFEHHATGAYDQDFDGAWDAELPANGVAHEVGHLLGLSDDYIVTNTSPRQIEPKPGRENTMMSNGGPIDQTLIDRIGQQLARMGLIDKCRKQSWQGTLRVDETIGRAPNPPCALSYTADATLSVEGSRATGEASVQGSPNPCGVAVATTVPLPTQRTKEGFAIDAGQLTYGAPGTTGVKKSGPDQAHGTLTTTYPLPNGCDITYNVTVDLHCTNCSKAVG